MLSARREEKEVKRRRLLKESILGGASVCDSKGRYVKQSDRTLKVSGKQSLVHWSEGEYPEHCKTGSRGYFGKLGSVFDFSQK
jgi:uncharacterized membrane protein affecting hemolysin expression